MSSADEKHRKREREKARALRKSCWWQQKLEEGLCHYCGASFEKGLLTMDHIVPVARGGKSVKGNGWSVARAATRTRRQDARGASSLSSSRVGTESPKETKWKAA